MSMCAGSIVGALYFVIWQTYALRLEVIIMVIHMAFVLLEGILGLVTFVNIQKSISP